MEIPDEALRAIEEKFGSRFVRQEVAGITSEQPFASVFPRSIEEVEWLTKLAARHSVPLKAVGAGTALYPGKSPQALEVGFDEMREIRLPEAGEAWVETGPGITWMELEERLRSRGVGPRVYPTSAPKSTVGGWLGENGIGVGSYEHGWLLENVLAVEAVLAGGERHAIEGEGLRHLVGARGSMGFLVKARLAIREAAEDVPVGVVFETTDDLAGAILDLYRSGAPFWHLGFVNAAMARAGALESKHTLIGAYPAERTARIQDSLGRAVEYRQGRILSSEEARRLWEQRFFPANQSGPVPTPGRAFIQGARLVPALAEVERKLKGMAIQGTVARTGEVSLLAFDPDNPSFTKDLRLMRIATSSWMPERRR